MKRLREVVYRRIPIYSNGKYFEEFTRMILYNTDKNHRVEQEDKAKIFDNKNYNDSNLTNINTDLTRKESDNISNDKKKKNDKKKLINSGQKIFEYWNIFIDFVFSENEDNKYNLELNSLQLRYLEKKAKLVVDKIIFISANLQFPIKTVNKVYLNLCEKSIHKIKYQKMLNNQLIEIEEQKKEMKKHKGNEQADKSVLFQLQKKQISQRRELNKVIQKLHENSEDEEETKKQKALENFFSKIDLEKYFEKEQIPDIKRGEFTSAIFDHDIRSRQIVFFGKKDKKKFSNELDENENTKKGNNNKLSNRGGNRKQQGLNYFQKIKLNGKGQSTGAFFSSFRESSVNPNLRILRKFKSISLNNLYCRVYPTELHGDNNKDIKSIPVTPPKNKKIKPNCKTGQRPNSSYTSNYFTPSIFGIKQKLLKDKNIFSIIKKNQELKEKIEYYAPNKVISSIFKKNLNPALLSKKKILSKNKAMFSKSACYIKEGNIFKYVPNYLTKKDFYY